ncbi:hypothetical protein L596_020089 [Steinernema carpocapsae]|uniref:Uncharacterized protein n=1 Tax=Steinernema carpocapsae TaxID=34508 RepID=A0A4U5MSH8_STECR|nr:hypothetical protein L596_020089 [Steinernema carpocapsae]
MAMDPYRVFLLLKKHFELKYPLAVADHEEFLSNEVELALSIIEQIEGEAFSPTEDGLILADELLLDTTAGNLEGCIKAFLVKMHASDLYHVVQRAEYYQN